MISSPISCVSRRRSAVASSDRDDARDRRGRRLRRRSLHFYSTFGWMPLATEAALGTLDYWDDRGDELLENVAARASQLCSGSHARSSTTPRRARPRHGGRGRARRRRRVSRIVKRCRDRGLIVIDEEDDAHDAAGAHVDEQTVEQALAILERAASSPRAPIQSGNICSRARLRTARSSSRRAAT